MSYEDVQEYFDRKVLREGHHPTTRLSGVMSVGNGLGLVLVDRKEPAEQKPNKATTILVQTHLRTVYPNDPISEV